MLCRITFSGRSSGLRGIHSLKRLQNLTNKLPTKLREKADEISETISGVIGTSMAAESLRSYLLGKSHGLREAAKIIEREGE